MIRISPKDATSLVDVTEPGTTRKKVAGAEYAHFGAFFDRMWRRNDILWGRLDAAESLIEALMPQVESGETLDKQEREELVTQLREEAQREIIWEELDPESKEELERLIVTTLVHMPREQRTPQRLYEYVEHELGGELNPRLQMLIRGVLDPERLLRFYEQAYSFETRVDPAPLARSLARGAHVAGQVFREASERRRVKLLARPTAWAARAGRLLLSLVEAAIPGTLGHLFYRHWVTVLYLLGLLTILGGVVVGDPRLQQFGWTVVAVTFLFNVVIFALGDFLRGRRRWKGVLGAALFLLTLAAAGLILLGVRHLGQDLPSLRPGGTLPPPAPTLPFESALVEGALRTLAVPGLLAVALLLTVAAQGRRLRRALVPRGIVDLEFAGTEARVEEIREAWGSPAISAARVNLAIDFAFAAAYGVALYLLCTWAKTQWDGVWSLAAWAGVILAYGQLLAALFDIAENGLLLAILGRDQPGDGLSRLVRLLAGAKFLAVGFGTAYILGGLTRFIYAEAPNRWLALLPPLGVAAIVGMIAAGRRVAAVRRRRRGLRMPIVVGP